MSTADADDDEPVFSPLSGRLMSRRAPTASADDAASSAGGADATVAVAETSGGALARRGDYAIARSGSEALARRAYRGLEPRLGEHAPARVVEGLDGIASSFAGEGEARAEPVSGLLEGADAPSDDAVPLA